MSHAVVKRQTQRDEPDAGLDGLRRWFYGGEAPAGDTWPGDTWPSEPARGTELPVEPKAPLALALAARRCCGACRQAADMVG